MTSGTKTSVNIAGPYAVGTHTFTIGPYTSGIPIIFGNDSSLDQVSLTNATITYTAGIGPVDLTITYAFVFPLPANSQTYGIQIGGTFKRSFVSAVGDTVNVTSSPVFFDGEGFGFANQIDGPAFYNVSTSNTSNTFGPLPAPKGGTEVISCTASGGVGCTSPGADYLMETVATIHFAQPGDSVKIPNSFDAVSGESLAEVQAQLDALAAADAAALAPEPNILLLLLGSGLAGLGLSRLRHVRRRAGQ